MGDACCRLDDGGERAQGGAGALEDQEGGERERGGRDQELDQEQARDGAVDARAAGAEGESRSVREDLVEDQQRPCVRIVGPGPGGAAVSGEPLGAATDDPFEREARNEWLQRRAEPARSTNGPALSAGAQVAVEFGAVGEGDRGDDGGEDDREQGEGDER